MHLSLVVPITNPLSSNYLTFFASIRCWSNLVDEIVIVDGGTSDESYSYLKKFDINCEIKILRDDLYFWDINGDFSPNQVNDMFNSGIKYLEHSDWIFLAPADYVLCDFDRKKLELELNDFKSEQWLKFTRFKLLFDPNKSIFKKRYDVRGSICLNNKKIKSVPNYPYLMGILEYTSFIYDYPIQANQRVGFNFKNTKNLVIFRGKRLEGGSVCLSSLKVFVPDHFFYEEEQAISQRISFNEYFDSRSRGLAKYRRMESKLIVGCNRKEPIPFEALLRMPVPSQFKELIKANYNENMLGAFVRNDNNKSFLRFMFKSERYIRSKLYRSIGLRGVFEVVDWRLIDQPIKIYNLTKLYRKQDKYF